MCLCVQAQSFVSRQMKGRGWACIFYDQIRHTSHLLHCAHVCAGCDDDDAAPCQHHARDRTKTTSSPHPHLSGPHCACMRTPGASHNYNQSAIPPPICLQLLRASDVDDDTHTEHVKHLLEHAHRTVPSGTSKMVVCNRIECAAVCRPRCLI